MNEYKVLGLMSGTSLDGLDLAYCHFWKEDDQWTFEIKKAITLPYQDHWRNKLETSIQLNADELLKLHRDYGLRLGHLAKEFIEEEGIEVDFIASHGHTVHHRPELGFTFQLGSGQHIALASERLTICDFRTKDVALGGQGAPLVPIGDEAFFSNYNFCLNLGGISNVSMSKSGKRIAYDIGIANMLLNHLSQRTGQPFDRDGKLAESGKLDQQLLNKLNTLEYYQESYPKSTGLEWFQDEILPIVQSSELPVEDLLHTSVKHICEQISNQLRLNTIEDKTTVLVTGGGAFNRYLISELREMLASSIEVIVPDDLLVSFKEALIFAYMGMLRMEGEINVLSSVTGAKQDSCSGFIYTPD